MSADETACDACGYCPRQDDIADEMVNISTQSIKATKLLAELVEAVRALKPAPEPRVFMTAAGPIKVSSADHAETNSVDSGRGMTVDEALRHVTEVIEPEDYGDNGDAMEALAAEVRRLREENKDLQGDKEAWRQVFDHVREQCDPEILAESGHYVFRCVSKMREEIAKLQHLLSEERKLTAATAEHTTALERKVAELTAKWTEQRWPTWDEACHILMDVHGPETAVYQAARVLLERVVELENPKPGATP
jgi:Fe-S cluster biosynthesis and repair protein YggX